MRNMFLTVKIKLQYGVLFSFLTFSQFKKKIIITESSNCKYNLMNPNKPKLNETLCVNIRK